MTTDRSLLVLALVCACACSSSDDNSGAPSGQQGGGAGGIGGAGGTSGAGGASGSMASGGTSAAGVGSVGGGAGMDPIGGTSAMTDAMIEDDASGPGVDGGELAPFQSIAWPTDDAVVELDMMGAFGTDVSGMTYAAGTLWLSMNLAPSKLYKMEKNGASWQRVAGDGWSSGKSLLFPDGSGVPDAEGVTLASPSSSLLYIGSERNLQGASAATSRSSVLSYDPSGAGASLTAQREWNLTSDLPSVSANQGLEAVTWIPDSQLAGFYDPSAFPTHGDGLFVVGLESQSGVYFFALGSDGSVDLIATLSSELTGVMGLEYDASAGYLWVYCDNTCDNQAEIWSLLPSGEYARRASVAPPATLPNINNEGIAIAPDAECAGGIKPFYWVEDGNTDGHVLRAGTIPCGAFLESL